MRHRTLYTAIPSPAAGADFQFTPAQGEAVRVIALLSTLTTSATVANRLPGLRILDQAGNVVYRVGSATAQVASQTIDHDAAPALSDNQAGFDGANTQWSYPWPDLWLPAGWQIASLTSGLAAGDQWSGIVLLAEFGRPEWDMERRLAMLEQVYDQIAGTTA